MRIVFFPQVLAALLIFFGVSVIFKPVFKFKKFDNTIVDASDYKWMLSFSAIGVAISIIYLSTKQSRDEKYPDVPFLICPKCEETYNSYKVPEGKCPKCNEQLKDLKGFYDKGQSN